MRGRRRRGRLRRIFDLLLTAAIPGLLALIALRLDEPATTLVGVPVVNDGDTLTLAGERIRLRGIDAPELRQTCRRGGADYGCGREAREALGRFVRAGDVECLGSGRDRYGRLLAVCEAGGVEINRALVEEGWAVAFGDYEDIEAAARARGAGLWAGEFDRPRDWRAVHGGAAEFEHTLLHWLRAWWAGFFGAS